MGLRRFDDAVLARVRALPIEDALTGLGIYYQIDPDYRPVKNSSSKRLMISATQGFYEIVLTPPMKWFDSRSKKGGGGAIDLVMYIRGCTFVEAVKLLQGVLKTEKL